MRPLKQSHMLGLLAVVGIALLLSASHSAAQDETQAETSATAAVGASGRAAYKLPKLFDFEHYKRLFGKTYGSLVEELARKRYFFSRAFTAFVTGVQYKFRRMSHFLALNSRSDQSREERAQTRNKLMEESRRAEAEAAPEVEERAQARTELPEFLPAENENVERDLVKLIDEHKREPGFDELAREMNGGSARRRRSLDSRPPRDFSLDQLIAGEGEEGASRMESSKVVRDVEGNNPEYEPFELDSFGLDETERIKWVNVHKTDPRPVYQQATSFLVSWLWRSPDPVAGSGMREPETKEDAVFVDLNESQCMFMPRDQYNCGACYAFAATAIMEYQYCKKTNNLVALSEQYFVDCGKGRFDGYMRGCNGATDENVANFVHNFGLETKRHFPYAGRETKCPYKEDMDLKKTGYIRMPIEQVARVHTSKWEEALPNGPLYVGIAAGEDFDEYGGGVYDGRGCVYFENHAVVMVGHGREDGQEYWLIRNSYGIRWGVKGHMKLAKSATSRCIPTRTALAYGSKDGIHYDVEPTLSRPETGSDAASQRSAGKDQRISRGKFGRKNELQLTKDELSELMNRKW